ncbi:ABC transporter permease [Parvibaculum sp.]|uniref:ABC transporter permease n=1 Tax=Parvibaculum sp. TaxID=2024848 RepID=UPI0027313BE6|nr:ABC transporter permease [Parvibaculum sp.]MDP1627065.1 ABC transporter permease [Parvibaculum sp.]MDP2149344.1 ABC transporter permease [Parvibaculum sp.]MDP3326813.1 ABC transporter permease [Parvibaculum sp.]
MAEVSTSSGRSGETGGPASCRMEADGRHLRIEAAGDWSIVHLDPVDRQLRALTVDPGAAQHIVIDLKGITRFDTAAAAVIERTAEVLKRRGVDVEYKNVSEAQNKLFDKIDACGPPEPAHPPAQPLRLQILGKIGETTRAIGEEGRGMLGFIGAVMVTAGRTIRHPGRFRLIPFVHHMEKAGFDALPLVCLLTFLIGAVVAQQGAVQLRQFGAEVFTVNLIAIIFLREVGLLLTAIIVAGRSGSAFTAEIGSMKMREEIDAMRTLGLDPMDMLVLPRVLALMVTLPLLTFVADIMGLIGGGIVVQIMLNMSPAVYIARVQEAVGFWTFGVGLVKAPFMAAVIALVGCRAGFSVTGSAESVGAMTTRSVVRSIFLVIILDALFAMFFTAVGI